MKRALVFACLGFLVAFTAFAQFSGSWDVTITLLPKMDLSSTLTIEYTCPGWTFASISDFNANDGFASQKFTLNGALGPLTLASEMVFLPNPVWGYIYEATQTPSGCPVYDQVTVLRYGPVMDYSKTTLSLSFAGLTAELLMFQRGFTHEALEVWRLFYYPDQTPAPWYLICYDPGKCLGTGFRVKIGAEYCGAELTSYTYFGMTETWRFFDPVTGCPQLTPRGIFNITCDGCCFCGFEEIVTLKGLPVCCGITLNAALKIDCYGFSSLFLYTTGVPFFNGITLSPWVRFTIDEKEFGFCGTLGKQPGCITITPVLVWSEVKSHNDIPNFLEGIAIKEISLTCEISDCTKFSASAILYDLQKNAYYKIDDPNQWVAVVQLPVPWDYLDWKVCLPEASYFAWEKWAISFCGAGCCGGKWTVDVTTYFGKGYEVEDFDVTFPTEFMLEEQIPGEPPEEPGKCIVITPIYGREFQLGTLFGWMLTEVSASVPMSADISLTVDLAVSFLGIQNLSVGFSFQF